MTEYDGVPRDLLAAEFAKCKQLLRDEEMAETPVEKKVNHLKNEIKSILKAMTDTDQAQQPSAPTRTAGPTTQLPHTKELTSAMDKVPKFESGVEVSSFIPYLDLHYNNYVATHSNPETELQFVRQALGRMSIEYATNMQNHRPPIATYAMMKEYLKKNYATKESVYQILDKIWNLEQLESENYRDFGLKLDEKVSEVHSTIVSKFESYKKDQDSDTDATLNTLDLLKLTGGQVFLQHLKTTNRDVYNHIVSDLDKAWSAGEIANKALSFETRLVKEDNSPNQATFATNSKKNNLKHKICMDFLQGNCKWGENCFKLHDAEAKQSFKSLLDKAGSNRGSTSKNDTPKKSKKGSTNQNSTDISANQKQSFVATPVSLPTQDFHN